MTTLEHERRKSLFPLVAETVAMSIAFALIVTAIGWLWVGKTSPFNHGVAPDVSTSPSMKLWVVANFPAAILFVSVFGKLGSEWQYFFCVFVQWFVIGVGIGSLIAPVRRAKKCV